VLCAKAQAAARRYKKGTTGHESKAALMEKHASVLVIDHDVTSMEALRIGLHNNGLAVESYADAREAFRALAGARFDVVIADARVGPVDGLDVLACVHRHDPDVPVIVLAADGAVAAAAEAVRRGAFDYVQKPFEVSRVRALVERALEVRRLRQEVARLRAEVRLAPAGEEIIAQSAAMAPVFEAVRRAAAGDSSVLIVGAPGTGRELVARTIHRASPRAGKPFVVADCAALGNGLLESEVFGHVRGAFAGALADRPGLFDAAAEGTLFLDSVTELSKAAQARLLRVLEEGAVQPLGSAAARRVNVRLVAGAHADLGEAVRTSRFREDLGYRLSAGQVLLPPLRERPEDVPLLAHYFVKRLCLRLGREPLAISPEAMQQLSAGAWPGNVRELRDRMERAVLLAKGETIRPEDLEEPASG
jgi:two-component system response regulator AtoC